MCRAVCRAVRRAVLVFPVVLFSLNVFWFTKIVRGALKLLAPKKGAKGEAKQE